MVVGALFCALSIVFAIDDLFANWKQDQFEFIQLKLKIAILVNI